LVGFVEEMREGFCVREKIGFLDEKEPAILFSEFLE
jgi:hypothetical protein